MSMTREQRLAIREAMREVETAVRSINAALRFDFTDNIVNEADRIAELATAIKAAVNSGIEEEPEQHPAVLGDYVVTEPHGHRGRVYKVHAYCPESDAWLNEQADRSVRAMKMEPWVSVLVDGGGAVTVPQQRARIIAPFPFTNPWAVDYFGEER